MINGFVAVPIMIAMMMARVATSEDVSIPVELRKQRATIERED